MESLNRNDAWISIVTFYGLNHSKGKNYTLKHFNHLVKSRIVSRTQFYQWLNDFDNGASGDRKIGSGRPPKLDDSDLKKLKSMVLLQMR